MRRHLAKTREAPRALGSKKPEKKLAYYKIKAYFTIEFFTISDLAESARSG